MNIPKVVSFLSFFWITDQHQLFPEPECLSLVTFSKQWRRHPRLATGRLLTTGNQSHDVCPYQPTQCATLWEKDEAEFTCDSCIFLWSCSAKQKEKQLKDVLHLIVVDWKESSIKVRNGVASVFNWQLTWALSAGSKPHFCHIVKV